MLITKVNFTKNIRTVEGRIATRSCTDILGAELVEQVNHHTCMVTSSPGIGKENELDCHTW
jgi:hypothetical protein